MKRQAKTWLTAIALIGILALLGILFMMFGNLITDLWNFIKAVTLREWLFMLTGAVFISIMNLLSNWIWKDKAKKEE